MFIPKSLQDKLRKESGDDYDCKGDIKKQTPIPAVPPTTPGPTPPAGSLTCSLDRFSNSPPPTAGGGNGGPIGKYTGFTIPYRDTSCRIASDKLTALAELPVRWSAYVKRTPDLAQKARQNVIQNFPIIQQKAVEYGWNPAFVLALWIEESAAGQDGLYGMGCLYGQDSNNNWYKMPEKSDGCQQAACLFSYPTKDPNNFEKFLCSYASVCDEIAAGVPWGWPQSVKLAYTLVSEAADLPAHCWLRE